MPDTLFSSFPDFERRKYSLRKLVLNATGQDVFRCRNCGKCNVVCQDEIDISIDSLVLFVIQDDEEVLTSKTLWSDRILDSVQSACQRGLNLRTVFLALRNEAIERNLIKGSTA